MSTTKLTDAEARRLLEMVKRSLAAEIRYSEEYGRGCAYPAEDIESERFVENTMTFFERFHVVEPPNITYQLE